MKTGIDLNSQDWCEIVFEGKNKAYGAFEMRQSSSNRHLLALFITLGISTIIAFFPRLLDTIGVKNIEQNIYTDVISLSNIPVNEVKEQEIVKPKEMIPPKVLASIKYTPPVIVTDELVSDENELKPIDEIREAKGVVGIYNVPDGSLDADAHAMEDLITDRQITQQGSDKNEVFIQVEIMPAFPGGVSEMMQFISRNIKYPVMAIESNIQGRVFVNFVVDETGDIVGAKVVKGIDPACDKEALRVVNLMPKWVPGKQNGHAVRVQYTLPIVFSLKG